MNHPAGIAVKRLTVGVAARCLNTAHVRGMGRYVYDMIDQARTAPGPEWVLFGDDHRYPMAAPAGMTGRAG